PAVLPGAHVVPARAVLPQPPRALSRGAVRLRLHQPQPHHRPPPRAGRPPAHSRTIAASLERVGYRTAMVGKYLNACGVMPSRVTGRSSIDYVPAGWTAWMAGLDTIWPAGSPYRGNSYNYFSFPQTIDGAAVALQG